MTIREIQADHYRIPLPVALSDSTHGTIQGFELVTVRVRDVDGAEGVGYTYTVGTGGAAVQALLARDLAPLLRGRDPDRIEELWQAMWWALHYGGRGGAQVLAISAVDIALWDLRARRLGTPLWRLLGGFDPRVPCYAGGIDLDFTLDALLRQTDDNLARGFRAIKMKVGRPVLAEDVERVRAMRAHLGDGFPLMVDANMRWSVDEAIRAARALRELRAGVAGGADHPRRCARPRAHRARGRRCRWRRARTCTRSTSSAQLIAAGGVTFPEPDVTNCGGVTVFMKVCHLAEAFNLPVTSHGAHDITRAPAGSGTEPLLPGSPRLRPRSVHRRAAQDRGGGGGGAGPARAWRRVRLEVARRGAGGLAEAFQELQHGGVDLGRALLLGPVAAAGQDDGLAQLRDELGSAGSSWSMPRKASTRSRSPAT